MVANESGEWLEADGLGGFASGTVGDLRTRRYHALLLCAQPDGSRCLLVNGVDAFVETPAGSWPVSSQAYAGGIVAPDARATVESFVGEPWPRWIFALPDGTRVEREILAHHGRTEVLVSWRLLTAGPVTLRVRPFFSGRGYHHLHHENSSFRFEPWRERDRLVFHPYDGVPAVAIASNGAYHHDPHWYRHFHYAEEAARGFEAEEDLAAPGLLTFDLSAGPALMLLSIDTGVDEGPVARRAERIRRLEAGRRAAFPSPLARAADAYIVARDGGKTIIAGYPWFTDWGRDTFIAMRGLCLATGRFADARAILLRWADVLSEGMLPNRFVDEGGRPEYNSVDAALWFVVAVHDYLRAAGASVSAERAPLVAAVESILTGYLAGTRHRIGATADGLLAAGEPGAQLTWMDAKVGDRVVTPRIGKPVEIQALWLNALFIGGQFGTPSAARWQEPLARGRASFAERFWNSGAGCLYDVVDSDHQPGAVDASVRPNQIFAVGGLPLTLFEGQRARAIVDVVEAFLLTPLGLRSLSPEDARYCPHYEGSPGERDAAYHQGTAWVWLLGPFVEAWLRVRGETEAAKAEARRRFVAPLLRYVSETGVGHLPELVDGAAPHSPRGCPFQAWSLGELLRMLGGHREAS